VILLVATGGIAWEAIQRFFEPAKVAGVTVMVVASTAFRHGCSRRDKSTT
jgi:Co/Zn/Cd efflux system component